MKSVVAVVVVSMFAAAGCAKSASRAEEPVSASPAQSHAEPALTGRTIEGPPVRSVEVPAAASGQPREVKVLVDEPAVKLVAIVLRGGTVLPEHHSNVPVTIQAVRGAGVVTAGGQQMRLDTTHPVVLAEKVPHAVAPDPGTDLVLLVHHFGRAAPDHAEGKH